MICALVAAAACGGRSARAPAAATSPEPVASPEPPRAPEPAPSGPTAPLEAAAPPAPTTPSKPAKPTEAAAPSTPSEPTNVVSDPFGPPANESDDARAARLDLRDRLARGCSRYLTAADVKQVCGSKLQIVDPARANEPPDEWPPACQRTTRRTADFHPLPLTIDNEASAPRTVVAMSAQDRGRVRSLELGDESLIYTDQWKQRHSHGVVVAAGTMVMRLVVSGRNEKTVPCSEAELVTLAGRILERLPR